jgi:uncharacterized protein (DUF58 family)
MVAQSCDHGTRDLVSYTLVVIASTSARAKSLEELLGAGLLARLDRLDVMSRKVFAGKLPGERRSKRRGRSVEFDDYRAYVAGDDLRHVDWNVFARMDRFFLKLYREEEDLALHVAVDVSASMDAGEASKMMLAQRLAIALGYIGLVNNNRVVMSCFGSGRVRMLSAVRGRRNVKRMARFVIDEAAAARGEAPSFAESMRGLALSRSGRGVLVVLSDFLYQEDLRVGLNYLAGGSRGEAAFDTYCTQILSPGELDPASERERGLVGDLRLTDVETGRAAEVTVSAALLKKYRERLEAHLEGLRKACAARQMTHVLLRSDADVETLLVDVLRRRGLVG